ncbi:hypothetical protein [Burkholderia cepacia]|uniref:hypothetical protein n=1 Tax=Burkholderia cepacia TaxID=292 RepID=UPI002AB7A4A2|nr:hypothetical protein [Burkholderia cepacia]
MTIDVRPASAGSSGPGVDIAIRDTGIGIPDDSMSTLFDVYIRTNASIYRCFGGTGSGVMARRPRPRPVREQQAVARRVALPARRCRPGSFIDSSG